jgi:hypothetical protein
MSRGGFSFASVVLSYFLVGGGIVLGLVGVAATRQTSPIVLLSALAAGSFVGGFVAARVSHGSTILEPAVGSLLLCGSVAALIVATPVGGLLWHLASEEVGRASASVAGASAVGALLGAFLSEKLLGEAGSSSLPWIIYTALATCGACFVAYLSTLALMLGDVSSLQSEAGVERGGVAFLAGIGAGCLLSGLAVGASSRRRALVASLLGATLGAMGFFYLVMTLTPKGRADQNQLRGLAIIAAAGGMVTVIGNLMGWAMRRRV